MSDVTTTNREAFASEVRALMGRHRVSQARLAVALGMSQSALSRRLNGDQPFDIDDLFKIAEHFGTEVGALLPSPKSAWFTADDLRSRECDTVEGPVSDRRQTQGETADWRSGDRGATAQTVAA